MITPIQLNGINKLNVERIRVPRRLSFKGQAQTEPQAEQTQKSQNQDKFVRQAVK